MNTAKPLTITPGELRQLEEIRHTLEQMVVHSQRLHDCVETLSGQLPPVEATLNILVPGNLESTRGYRAHLLYLALPSLKGLCAELNNQIGQILNKLKEGRLHVLEQHQRPVIIGSKGADPDPE